MPHKLKFIWRTKGRRPGQWYYYYRRGGRSYRLPDLEAPDFLERYNAIDRSFRIEGKRIIGPRKLKDLITRYRQSPEYRALAAESKKIYETVLRQLEEKRGERDAASFTRKNIIAYRDRFLDRPRRGNMYLNVLRVLFSLAADLEWIETDPTIGVKRLKLPDTGGYATWTEEELARLLSAHTTPAEVRRAVLLGVNTGQRISDVVSMTWGQWDGSYLTVRQQKTGKMVYIPFALEFRTEFESWRGDSLVIVTGVSGKPYTRNHLIRCLRGARRACGLRERLSFHGLRKLATVRLLEAGCTGEEVRAITGFSEEQQAIYSQAVNLRRLADAAVEKLERKR